LKFPRDGVARYHPINKKLWDGYCRGRVSGKHVAVERFRLLLAELGHDPRRARSLARAYLACLSRRGDVLPGARRALRLLRRRFRLAVVTNGYDRVQRARLRAARLYARFDVVVTSERAGFAKPDPRIVHAALSALRVTGAQALYVGDDLHTDLGAASAAGVRFVWIDRGLAAASGRGPRRRVRSLLELAERL
jgi:HAD superfamily hydrolase (TIGR01509 family)